jgi:hypothetical protein
LASQALALSNKEAILQEKEKAQSLALDTLYNIKTQKSQLEIAQKLLTHSEKELQWQRQTSVAEFGRREDALKQKEKELQNIKDRENQEEMDSLTFRELSFSSKHANDADKLIKWHQELEQSSQEIHTQHARLDEDRFKIEEQIKELLKKR